MFGFSVRAAKVVCQETGVKLFIHQGSEVCFSFSYLNLLLYLLSLSRAYLKPIWKERNWENFRTDKKVSFNWTYRTISLVSSTLKALLGVLKWRRKCLTALIPHITALWDFLEYSLKAPSCIKQWPKSWILSTKFGFESWSRVAAWSSGVTILK